MTDEFKTMTLNDPETGGYVAPPEWVNEVITEAREITPALQIATVRTTTAHSMNFPVKLGTMAAKRRGELEPKTKTPGLKYAVIQMELPEMYARDDVTQMDLEDAGFNLEADLKAEMTDSFNARIGQEFISGSGPLEMEGILTNANVAEVKTGHATLLTADQLIELVDNGLKAQFGIRATLMMNQQTRTRIRQMKYSGSDEYIWTAGFEKTPPTILGKNYHISEDMDNVAAGKYPIVFGDWKRGYVIGMRVRIIIKRIEDSATDEAGVVLFSGRMRIGGKVRQAAAIVKQKVSA